MRNDLKALEEELELAKENYNRIKTEFIKDAELNFAIYKQDLNYLVAIDILKASEFMLNTYSKYLNTVLETKNDLVHSEVDEVVEITLKTNRQVDKELKPYFNLDPQVLKNQFDEALKALKNG